MDDLQKKYGVLLQPIKDLTKSWEVDVTHILKDYMGDLEKMTFSFDNGETVLNFAEASMLIQGTACVWSKKVEFLYSLVKQTLDMISSKEAEAEQGSKDNSKDETENFDFDEGDKLLVLDDITMTSERRQVSATGAVEPLPTVPVSMLENDTENRGRVIINHYKSDVVSHSNDFWEACFVPLDKKMSVLDRDCNGIVDRIIVPALLDMKTQPITVLPEPASPVEPDPPMDDFADNSAHSFEEENQHCMELRERRQKDPSLVFAEEPLPTTLDPNEPCLEPSWADKLFKKLNSFRIPESLTVKTRKRKFNGESPVEAIGISRFIFKKLSKNSKIKSENLFTSFAGKLVKERNHFWHSVRSHKSNLKAEVKEVHLPNDEMDHSALDDDPFDDLDEINQSNIPSNLDALIGDIADNQNHKTETTTDCASSYEDLVRQHVEMFYQAAQRHKEMTALSQRVKVWEETITPRLAEQDTRPEFDIHKYGDVILGKFVNIKECKKFMDVAESRQPWYICRLFAATLQLVNDSNFVIDKEKDFSKSVNTMTLTLLSHHKLRERLSQYTSQN